MKKYCSILFIAAMLLCILCGCNNNSTSPDDPSDYGGGVNTDFAKTDSDMFTDRDQRDDYDANGSIPIQLNGDSASCASGFVQISGSTVTITKEATYVISGTLDDGMIIINADDSAKLQIVLNGAVINSSSSAALYIQEADKVVVTLSEGTENALKNGGYFEAIDDNNIDGAIFSKQDLTFNGSGSLTVTSPAGHGIVCKDDLVFTGGNYTVSATSHGLDVNDSVRISNTQMTIDAGKDGIQAENADDASLGFVYISSGILTVEAAGDGISAQSYIQIEDGSLNLTCGGGSENGTQSSSPDYGNFPGGMGGGHMPRPRSTVSTSTGDSTSMKGLKVSGSLLINGGSFAIDSADDALHSNASIVINGGTFLIASGDDAVHADETLKITHCTMNITESYEGLEALEIYISGGEIRVVSTDDGLNAAGGTDSSGAGGRDDRFGGQMGGGNSNGYIEISGGDLYIRSSGDGIDANGSFLISGGYTVIVGPTTGDTATLDYDKEGKITGGTFIGTGSSMMAQSFSSSTQGVIALSVGNATAGTQILLTDANGNTVIDYTPELSFAVVILSTPDMVSGEDYTISVGSASGTFSAS